MKPTEQANDTGGGRRTVSSSEEWGRGLSFRQFEVEDRRYLDVEVERQVRETLQGEMERSERGRKQVRESRWNSIVTLEFQNTGQAGNGAEGRELFSRKCGGTAGSRHKSRAGNMKDGADTRSTRPASSRL